MPRRDVRRGRREDRPPAIWKFVLGLAAGGSAGSALTKPWIEPAALLPSRSTEEHGRR
jgi:hypothetical protein